MLIDDINNLLNLERVAKYTIGTNSMGLTVLTDTSNCSTLHTSNIIKANIEKSSYSYKKRSVSELEQVTLENEALANEEILERAAKKANTAQSTIKEAEVKPTSPYEDEKLTWAPKIHHNKHSIMTKESEPFNFLGSKPSYLLAQFTHKLSVATSNNSSQELNTSIETSSPGSTNSDSNQGSQALSLDETLAQKEAQGGSAMSIETTEMVQASSDEDQKLAMAPRMHREPAKMKEGSSPFNFLEDNSSSLFTQLATRLSNITSGNNSQELDTSIELTSPESTNSDSKQGILATIVEKSPVEENAASKKAFKPFNKANKPVFSSQATNSLEKTPTYLSKIDTLSDKLGKSLLVSPDLDTPHIIRKGPGYVETPLSQLDQKLDEVFSRLFSKIELGSNKASEGIKLTIVVDNGEDPYYEEDDYYSSEELEECYSSDQEMSCAGEAPSYPQLD